MNENELIFPLTDEDTIMTIVYIAKDTKYQQLMVVTPERVALSPETYETVWGPFFISIPKISIPKQKGK